jgi:hypothetical protein
MNRKFILAAMENTIPIISGSVYRAGNMVTSIIQAITMAVGRFFTDRIN